MENEKTLAAAKAKAALDALTKSYAYFDAETAVTCETPAYCEYLVAA